MVNRNCAWDSNKVHVDRNQSREVLRLGTISLMCHDQSPLWLNSRTKHTPLLAAHNYWLALLPTNVPKCETDWRQTLPIAPSLCTMGTISLTRSLLLQAILLYRPDIGCREKFRTIIFKRFSTQAPWKHILINIKSFKTTIEIEANAWISNEIKI